MRKVEEIIEDHITEWLDVPCIEKEWAIACMKEYAREVLQDFDNWKAHRTPDLVKQYIKEKGL